MGDTADHAYNLQSVKYCSSTNRVTVQSEIMVLRICSLVCFTIAATVILSTQTSCHHNGT